MQSMDDIEYEYYEAEEENYDYSPPTTTKFVKVQRMPVMRDMMLAATSTGGPASSYQIRDRNAPSTTSGSSTSSAVCAVCGDGQAKLHYGVLACYGCKGFFRRTLAGKYRYNCRFGNNCIVDKYQRNSCRYCRFNRCIEVGMDPKAVRPDRDLTGKQRMPRMRKKQIDEELLNHMMRLQGDDWSRKLPVEVRILLMQLMNVEGKVVKGEEGDANTQKPMQPIIRDQKVSLREMFEQKPLTANRSLMGYEPYRMARPEELAEIAHRRAIAAVDWVDALTEIAEIADTEDKVNLVKSCYSPLTIFNFSARTAQNTKNPDILCLCSHSYVPRQLPAEFNETNHLSNVLIDRTLNELVTPLRKLNLKEEEIVPLKAIIILNPNTKGLSQAAKQAIGDLRDKVQDMLFQIVKELHPIYSASSRFGNLLLLLPTITTLSGLMSENMQFCQTFGGRQSGDPLLSEMFGDFKFNFDDATISSSSVTPPLFENPAEISLQSISPPLLDSPGMVSSSARRISRRDAETQTDESGNSINHSRSSNSLIGGHSPPMFLPSVSISSPFHSFLDEEMASRDLNLNPLVDLGPCDDLLNY